MPQTEVHNLNEELAKQLPATAYYNLYGYLDEGYGVRTEEGGKYAYLRKAADLGSREAQYIVGMRFGARIGRSVDQFRYISSVR